MVLSKTMEDGDTANYDAVGPVYISLGRADFVDVTVDGVAIDDGNGSGKPRKMQLTPIEDPAGTGGSSGTDTATTQ